MTVFLVLNFTSTSNDKILFTIVLPPLRGELGATTILFNWLTEEVINQSIIFILINHIQRHREDINIHITNTE